MTCRNRETLKNYFRNGQLPTQEHFADLIDSMLNMSDEGFVKSVENGEEIYAPVGHDALMSFYRDQMPQQALWRMALSAERDQLQFQTPAQAQSPDQGQAPLLNLDRRQRVGIGTAEPQATLDVRGAFAAQGRRGNLPLPGPVWANGQWQDLTGDLEGCQGFELMAGAGQSGSGHFGLLHAVALSTYNPHGLFAWFQRRRGIRQTQAWWSGRGDRLQLRWAGSEGRKARYRLQIKTGCFFGEGVQIQVHLSQLWFDPHMDRHMDGHTDGHRSRSPAGGGAA
ncbi:MAG: hypothetical protein AB3X37_09020 [Leptothrix ochracea]|uniref:hypothetical protein n=1 Tax=Leptothrix ochracea TaxID=735331 RepID=UPI0034E2455C